MLVRIRRHVLYLSLHDNVVKAGDRAPDFSIQADNGKTITAHDFGGKLLILNFWATWCPPCVDEVPSLNQLQRALGPQGRGCARRQRRRGPAGLQGFSGPIPRFLSDCAGTR